MLRNAYRSNFISQQKFMAELDILCSKKDKRYFMNIVGLCAVKWAILCFIYSKKSFLKSIAVKWTETKGKCIKRLLRCPAGKAVNWLWLYCKLAGVPKPHLNEAVASLTKIQLTHD